MIKFIKEWVGYGNKKKDIIFSFTCNYIAFNCLYGKFTRKRNGYKNELNQIYNMLDKELYLLQRKEFSPYKLLNSESEMIKNPVSEMRYNTKVDKQKLEKQDVFELFRSIYFIRCNLFHGDKEVYNERDKKLILEANNVLKYFLEEYLKIKS